VFAVPAPYGRLPERRRTAPEHHVNPVRQPQLSTGADPVAATKPLAVVPKNA
jgi:hypothetical protein